MIICNKLTDDHRPQGFTATKIEQPFQRGHSTDTTLISVVLDSEIVRSSGLTQANICYESIPYCAWVLLLWGVAEKKGTDILDISVSVLPDVTSQNVLQCPLCWAALPVSAYSRKTSHHIKMQPGLPSQGNVLLPPAMSGWPFCPGSFKTMNLCRGCSSPEMAILDQSLQGPDVWEIESSFLKHLGSNLLPGNWDFFSYLFLGHANFF